MFIIISPLHTLLFTHQYMKLFPQSQLLCIVMDSCLTITLLYVQNHDQLSILHSLLVSTEYLG